MEPSSTNNSLAPVSRRHRLSLLEAKRFLDYQNCDTWLQYMQETFDTRGEIIRFSFLGNHMFFVRHPEHIDQVIRSTNFTKQGDFSRYVSLVMGDGLVTSQGNDKWRTR